MSDPHRSCILLQKLTVMFLMILAMLLSMICVRSRTVAAPRCAASPPAAKDECPEDVDDDEGGDEVVELPVPAGTLTHPQ